MASFNKMAHINLYIVCISSGGECHTSAFGKEVNWWYVKVTDELLAPGGINLTICTIIREC